MVCVSLMKIIPVKQCIIIMYYKSSKRMLQNVSSVTDLVCLLSIPANNQLDSVCEDSIQCEGQGHSWNKQIDSQISVLDYTDKVDTLAMW